MRDEIEALRTKAEDLLVRARATTDRAERRRLHLEHDALRGRWYQIYGKFQEQRATWKQAIPIQPK